MIKSTLGDLLAFVKKPDDRQISIRNFEKLKFILILIALNLVINIVVVLPLLYKIDEYVDLESKRSTYLAFTHVLIVTVILMPLLEEMVFRYFLRYIGLNTSAFKLEKWKRLFPFFVYFSTIVFSLLHSTNYANDTIMFFILSPLVVLSQFMSGMIMAFIRVRLNFFTGVFFHSLWNFLVVIAIPSIQLYISEPYAEKTQEYRIQIEEKLFFDQDRRALKIDSLDGKIHFVSSNQYTIQDLVDTLGVKLPYRYGDVIVELKFQSEDGISKKAFLDLLEEEYDTD